MVSLLRVSVSCFFHLNSDPSLGFFFQSWHLSGPLMDPRPETENGSDSKLVPGEWRDQMNRNSMSISELVSELRDTFLKSDFDRVEEALVAREAKLKAEIEHKKREIGSLQEKIEVERLDRVRAERESEKRMHEFENTVFELRNIICELEDEKKKWVGDGSEKRSWKSKFCELNEEKKMMEIDFGASASLKRKEHVGLGASGGRLGMGMVIDIGDSDEDECNSQGTLLKKETTSGIIADNEHPSSSAIQQKNFATVLAEPIRILKREFASSREFGTNINILDGLDDDTSSASSSSSSGSLDMDSLPLTSLTSNKKMRTEAANLRLNSSSR